MKIDTNSWHYKTMEWFYGEYSVPSNLCPYVRKLVVGGVMTALVGILLAGAALGATMAVGWSLGTIAGWLATGMMLSEVIVALVVLGLVVLATHMLMWQIDTYRDFFTFRKTTRVPKEPGIFMSYIKAKHDKICPILEFGE